MSSVGADPALLTRLARDAHEPLRWVDRDRADVEDALTSLRATSDPWRLRLDPGLLAECEALTDGWRAVDQLLLDTAAAVGREDVAGAVALLLAGARARAVVGRGVTADLLLDELRAAAAGDPSVVAGWFDRLSADEIALLRADGDARLGSLDGAPLELRDAVNRRLVTAELDALRAEVDADGWAQRNLGIPFVSDGWRDGHQADLARIESLELLLEADLVLLFSAEGDGRAVAAYGDPTTAEHVATVVPGISNHLGNLRSTLDNTWHLQEAADDRRSGSTATIAWLGYDTPGSLGQHSHELVTQATHGGRAREAAQDLTRFLQGLDATRDGLPAHVSVVGHSYGSRVLGETLALGEVSLAEAVAVGSPGMGVDHVDDWALPDGTQVWAESAGTPDASWFLPGGGDDPVAHAPGHGRNPDDPAFGARGFDVDGASGHSAYFEVDEETGMPSNSLRSIAAIMTGQQPRSDSDLPFELAPGPVHIDGGPTVGPGPFTA